ncbi:MAG: hypothetical protein SNH27_10985, partial [Rikenellaceae bacterium]
ERIHLFFNNNENPWGDVIMQMRESIYSHNWTKDLVHGEDLEHIKHHNDKLKENSTKRYELEAIPFAYSANILRAKVVILTLNPGYNKLTNKILFNFLDDKYKEEIFEARIKDFQFDESKGLHISDIEQLLDCGYWERRISPLWNEAGLTREHVLQNIAMLQYVGYHSVAYKADKVNLPTTEYAKNILKFLANNSDCIFFIGRCKEWRKLLEEFNVSPDRIIVNDNRSQHLTLKNIKSEGFNKIVDILKSTSK